MNKVLLALVIIFTVTLTLAIVIDYNTPKTVDWVESFDEKSTEPYGLHVLYKELPRLFEQKSIKTVHHNPVDYFNKDLADNLDTEEINGIFFSVGHAHSFDEYDIEALLSFVEKGNIVFISDYNLPEILLEHFNLEVATIKNKDSLAYLSFSDPKSQVYNSDIDRIATSVYFDTLPMQDYEILGYWNDSQTLVNFIKIQFNEGQIFLHLEPRIFTNYNVLKTERHLYTEGALSYLPDEKIYFDAFNKYSHSSSNNAEKKSNLSWFLEQTSFKWAWYLSLILIFLFIIFNAKRRQRIIPIVKPLENTTTDFVKTISNLYFETKDHQNLIEKKINYFLEKIRTEYNLETTVLNDDFVDSLAKKSGKNSLVVEKVVHYIIQLQAQHNYTQDNLIKLNTYIEDFYT